MKNLRLIAGGLSGSEFESSRLPVSRDRQKRFVEYLFDTYRRPLLRYLTNLLSNADEAQEIVQQTYLRLLETDRLDPVENRAKAYLFRIATNLAYDVFRRHARWRQTPIDEHDFTSQELPLDCLADWEHGLSIVRQVLRDIAPRPRKVFLLHVVRGMSYRTIARHVGISTKTVERDIRFVFDLCQDRLKVWQRL